MYYECYLYFIVVLVEIFFLANFIVYCRYYKEAQKSNTVEKKDDHILPLDDSICGSVAKDKARNEKWFKLGLERISQGEVGVLLLAGKNATNVLSTFTLSYILYSTFLV